MATENRIWINDRDLVAISVFAALGFILDISIGLILTPIVSAVPLVGGLLDAIPQAVVVFLGAYLVPRRGSVFVFAIIFLTLATVTPSFGPPGAYKIAIGFFLGLTAELILIVFGRRPVTYIIATGLSFGATIPVTWMAWKFANLPQSETLRPLILYLALAYSILGWIGAAMGYWIYKSRLARISLFNRIRQDGRRGQHDPAIRNH